MMTRTIRAMKEKKYLRRNILVLAAVILIGALVGGVTQLPQAKADRVVTIFIGTERLEVSTAKTLVADVLADADITLDANYQRPFPALNEKTESGYIVIIDAPRITLEVDGQQLELTSWADTVDDLLAEQGITLDDDLLNFSLEDSVFTGQRIQVVRVTSELVYEEVVLKARTTYRDDSSLVKGKQQVVTQATDGKSKRTYEVIYHNGVEVSRSLVAEAVLSPPVTGLILRGTQPVASRSSSSIVEGIASWYGERFHGRLTASGVPYDMYAMTAAHPKLKFGTRVKVTYLKTGKSVIVEINDRGPHIAGRIIDLSAAAAKEIGLQADGIGKVRLEILK